MRAVAQLRTADVRPKATQLGAQAALAFLIAIPATGVWAQASGHDFARVAEVFVCLTAATALSLRGLPDTSTARPGWAIAAVLWLAAASLLHAPDLRMAAREATLTIGLVAVACVVARSVEARGMTALLATTAIAGASYAALSVVGLATNLSVADTFRPFDLLLGYDNGRFFNHVQTSMLPLLLLATLHQFDRQFFNPLAMFGLAMGIALLVVSEGRATGLALAVGAGAGTVLLPRMSRPLLRKTAIACGLAAVLYLVLFVAAPRLAGVPTTVLHVDGLADPASAQARFILWHIALDGIRRSPWLGIGPMHFSHTWNADAAHPHNVYLQVAEEWGVPMLVLLLGIAFVAMRKLYRAVRDHRGDEADRRLGLGLFATLIAIGVDGMLSGNFVMPVSQVWIAVVAGAAIGWVRRAGPPPAATVTTAPSRAGKTLSLALHWLPLVAMLWLSASITPELGVRFLDHPGPAGTTRDAGAPRFWSNGWF